MLNDIVDHNFLNTKKYKFIKDNLIIIYDFITKEEVDEIFKIINLKTNVWDYSTGNFSKYLTITKSYDVLENLTKRVQNILKNKNLTTSGFHTIHKFEIGDLIPEHIDYGDFYGNMMYGGAVYLNDNFEGGELYYFDHDIDIKPIPMAAVFHLSDAPHMVKPITKGIRYSLPFFIWKDIEAIHKLHNK